MIPKTKAEKAVRLVSEINRLVFALREAGRRGRAERAAAGKMVRESGGKWDEKFSNEAKK